MADTPCVLFSTNTSCVLFSIKPKEPQKPFDAFWYFSRYYRLEDKKKYKKQKKKTRNIDEQIPDFGKILAQEWRNPCPLIHTMYIEMERKDKERYDKEMVAYNKELEAYEEYMKLHTRKQSI